MTRLKVRAMAKGDMTGLRANRPDKLWLTMSEELEGVRAMSDVAVSVLAGEKVIACIGLNVIWKGNAHVWAIFSEDAGRYPHILQVCKGLRDAYTQALGIRRLQATASTDWPEATRLLRHCGFEREVNMKGYGPGGEDCGLFVRFAC